MWSVQISRKAKKQLSKIDKPQRLIIEHWVLDHLQNCENPRAVSGGKPLAGTEDGWRYRVGSYRLVCELQDRVLVVKVIRVGHRQGVYKQL